MWLGKVGFERLKISCITGDLPQERLREKDIYVDLSVTTDFNGIGQSDLLEDAVDYEKLAELCTIIAKDGKFQMLEAYAVKVLQELKKNPRITGARIYVRKSGTVKDVEAVTVELETS